MTVVDLCAGPGGWDEGVRELGLAPIGIELDKLACATGEAAGHRRHRADIAAIFPPNVRLWWGVVVGLIASPPCQGFSPAGKGLGRQDAVLVLAALEGVRNVHDLERVMAELRPQMCDPRTLLVLEPLRWALWLRPQWLAWEQVVPVLVLWQACARILQLNGYTTDTGVLNAEQYGVPQTRRRAILVARSAEVSAAQGPAELPTPTHSRYHVRNPERLDPGVERWVSMAEALGWGMTERPSMTVTGGGSHTGGAEPFGNQARQGMLREREAGRWLRSNYSGSNAGGKVTAAERGRTMRHQDQPATVITDRPPSWVRTSMGTPREGNRNGSHLLNPAERPAHTITSKVGSWAMGEGSPPVNGVQVDQDSTRRITVEEAAVLQTFPVDYPWQGNKGQSYQQVGDAVPPLLARAIVAAVMPS